MRLLEEIDDVLISSKDKNLKALCNNIFNVKKDIVTHHGVGAQDSSAAFIHVKSAHIAIHIGIELVIMFRRNRQDDVKWMVRIEIARQPWCFGGIQTSPQPW